MNQALKIPADHPLIEVTKLRLLAAALELQHLTSTAANIVPIPGGRQVIVIGTPAQVVRLLEIAPAAMSATTTAAQAATSTPQALTRCAAARDGDCTHAQCPQLRDGEPANTGRHCPLDNHTED